MRNKRKLLQLVSGFLTIVLLISAQVVPPAAAAGETHVINVPAYATGFSITLRVENEPTPFAGVEFGMTFSSESALKFRSFSASSAVQGSTMLPNTLAGGVHYFGFFRGSNAFSGNLQAGTVSIDYSGDTSQTIVLSYMQIARVSGNRSVGSMKPSPIQTYVINRLAPTGNDDDDNAYLDFEFIIDDEAVPLAGNLGSRYFDDVDESWFWASSEIDYLYEQGVVKGIGNRLYAPADNIQRGDFILMMVRAYDLWDDFDDNFADVPEDSYFYDAIGAAKKLDIARGTGGENFEPNQPITRQDMMAIVERTMRAIGKPLPAGGDADLAPFPDRDTIYDYAVIPVATLIKSGIIKGTGLGTIDPLGRTTRAEMAVVVYRLLMMDAAPAE